MTKLHSVHTPVNLLWPSYTQFTHQFQRTTLNKRFILIILIFNDSYYCTGKKERIWFLKDDNKFYQICLSHVFYNWQKLSISISVYEYSGKTLAQNVGFFSKFNIPDNKKMTYMQSSQNKRFYFFERSFSFYESNGGMFYITWTEI